jgi:hypothetical protein
LASDHLRRLQLAYDERFAREYGPWRPLAGQVTDNFLACGVLEHGFGHIRCDACAHEYLLAFSRTCRFSCPNCPVKRLALKALWLEESRRGTTPPRSRRSFAVPCSGHPCGAGG